MMAQSAQILNLKQRLIKDSYLPRMNDKLTYYITPGAGANATIIEKAVDNAKSMDGFPKDTNIQVLDSRDTAKAKGLCRIGDHPFQFYTTWMESADYKLIWTYHPKTSTLPLAYPQITKQFEEIRQHIGVVEVKPQSRIDLQCPFKRGVQGEALPPGFAKELGKLCNPAVELEVHITTENFRHLLTILLQRLHLVAQSFGGPNTKENMVFGTWGCNRNMLRAETAIDTVLRNNRNAKGTLTVTNEWHAFDRRRIARIQDSGIWKEHPRPVWFDNLNLEHTRSRWFSFIVMSHISRRSMTKTSMRITVSGYHLLLLWTTSHAVPFSVAMCLLKIPVDNDPT
jgi:hypothetical protein